MPSFELEFEVFCGTCGDGLCMQSDTRTSHRRSMPQVTVEACRKCLAKATDALEYDIDSLKQEMKELEAELDRTKDELASEREHARELMSQCQLEYGQQR